MNGRTTMVSEGTTLTYTGSATDHRLDEDMARVYSRKSPQTEKTALIDHYLSTGEVHFAALYRVAELAAQSDVFLPSEAEQRIIRLKKHKSETLLAIQELSTALTEEQSQLITMSGTNLLELPAIRSLTRILSQTGTRMITFLQIDLESISQREQIHRHIKFFDFALRKLQDFSHPPDPEDIPGLLDGMQRSIVYITDGVISEIIASTPFDRLIREDVLKSE